MKLNLEKETAVHSSILAWKIPWTEVPGGLQSMWLQRFRHNWSNLACTCAYAVNPQQGLIFFFFNSWKLQISVTEINTKPSIIFFLRKIGSHPVIISNTLHFKRDRVLSLLELTLIPFVCLPFLPTMLIPGKYLESQKYFPPIERKPWTNKL